MGDGGTAERDVTQIWRLERCHGKMSAWLDNNKDGSLALNRKRWWREREQERERERERERGKERE